MLQGRLRAQMGGAGAARVGYVLSGGPAVSLGGKKQSLSVQTCCQLRGIGAGRRSGHSRVEAAEQVRLLVLVAEAAELATRSGASSASRWRIASSTENEG
jgi:hypothetical protein